jgi:hypothetical protein
MSHAASSATQPLSSVVLLSTIEDLINSLLAISAPHPSTPLPLGRRHLGQCGCIGFPNVQFNDIALVVLHVDSSYHRIWCEPGPSDKRHSPYGEKKLTAAQNRCFWSCIEASLVLSNDDVRLPPRQYGVVSLYRNRGVETEAGFVEIFF